MMNLQEAIAESAQALDDAARSHKRAAAYHRRQARDARRRLERLKRSAAALGIRVIVESGAGKEFHGRHKESSARSHSS